MLSLLDKALFKAKLSEGQNPTEILGNKVININTPKVEEGIIYSKKLELFNKLTENSINHG